MDPAVVEGYSWPIRTFALIAVGVSTALVACEPNLIRGDIAVESNRIPPRPQVGLQDAGTAPPVAPTPPEQPPPMQPPTMEPPSMEPPTTEPPAMEPPAMEPPAMEPPAMEPPANALRFSVDIKPIFERHCTECHHDGRSLNFTAMPLSDAGPELTSDLILNAVMSRMPPAPRDRMSQAEIDQIRLWKMQGHLP